MRYRVLSSEACALIGKVTQMIERLNYLEINAKAVNQIAAANKHIASIDKKLRAMVELRVSQINGCVFCVDLHATQARDAGESQQRLDCLTAWAECPFFEPHERAAFPWAESIPHLPDTGAPDEVYEALKAHFTKQQIVDLTLIISVMNAWNRMAVSFRQLPEVR